MCSPPGILLASILDFCLLCVFICLCIYLWLLLLFSWWEGTVYLGDCGSNEPSIRLSDFRQIWSICWMILTETNRSTLTKTCPVAILSTTTTTLLRDRTRTFAARGQRLLPLKIERKVQALYSHLRRAAYMSRSTTLSEKLPAIQGYW